MEGKSTLNTLENVILWMKDILFPLFCISCQKEGSIWCNPCVQAVDIPGVFLCPVCSEKTCEGRVCQDCIPISFLDAHQSLFVYKDESMIGRLLHDLKYNFIEESLKPLEKFFSVFLEQHASFFSAYDVLVPVPLHPRRFAERGFNQSEKIVCLFEKQIHIPIEPLLIRSTYTCPQVGMSSLERKKNVQGIFSLNGSAKAKRIILVDDVYTTGSTLQECAKVLRENGAKEVLGLSIARAVVQ